MDVADVLCSIRVFVVSSATAHHQYQIAQTAIPLVGCAAGAPATNLQPVVNPKATHDTPPVIEVSRPRCSCRTLHKVKAVPDPRMCDTACSKVLFDGRCRCIQTCVPDAYHGCCPTTLRRRAAHASPDN